MKKSIQIDGMNCMGCMSKVKNALTDLSETKDVDIDLSSQKVELELSQDVKNDLLTNLIESAGHFKVVEITNL